MDNILLTKEDMKNICNGAGFFASGGGGEITLINALIDSIWELPDRQPVYLIDPDNVPDSEWVAVVAMAGAPSQFDPTTLAHYAPVGSLEYLSEKTGNTYNYMTPIEIGANTIIPIFVAAQTGKIVVDSSGTPRAVPKLQDTGYYTGGIPIVPVAFANDEENITKTFLTAEGNDVMDINVDGIMGGLLSAEPYNSTTGFCGYQMTGKTLKGLKQSHPQIMYTITMAKKLGEQLKDCQNKPFETIQSFLQNYNRQTYKLAVGIITDIKSPNNNINNSFRFRKHLKSGERFDYMTIEITDNEEIKWQALSVNESLTVYKEEKLQAMGPDLISFIDEAGNTYSNADLKIGQEIILIGTQATNEMRNPNIVADFLETIQSIDKNITEYIEIEKLQA